MIVCRLCGLTIEAIPEDAILVGKLYRFTNGEHHSLRKMLAPRTGPRRRKNNRNPDQEVPIIDAEPKNEDQTITCEVPVIIPVNIPKNENAMQRAFRLKKVA
jgi:hypothetical protein